jgi:hypothetical protein
VLEEGGEGGAEELAAVGKGGGLAAVQDEAVGCAVGGGFEVLGECEGVLDEEALEGGLGGDGFRSHGFSPP